MTKFQALDEFLDETIELPYRGKWYTVHAADAETGLQCSRGMAASAIVSKAMAEHEKAGTMSPAELDALAAKLAEDAGVKLQLDDDDEVALFKRLLHGDEKADDYDRDRDVWAQLFADRVPWSMVQHIGTTAMLWAAMGKADAMAYWESAAPKPKAPKAPQDRMEKQTRTTTRKAAASATRRQASTSGTKKNTRTTTKAAETPAP